MKKILKVNYLPALLSSFLFPLFASAAVGWQSLIVCGATNHPCKFVDLITLVKNFINDLVILALPAAAIAFAWAGFLILTSGGDQGKLKTGKGILIKVAIGFAWIIGAYVLVTFIMNTFVDVSNATNLL
jgi:hypothetical protein